MTRKDFIKHVTLATTSTALGQAGANFKALPAGNAALLPQRPYGRSGIKLSIIGMGGIVVMNETSKSAADIVARAVERGVNYFDVAPSYGDAELKLGPALAPYRGKVFLACKTQCRDRAGAMAQFERSCELLKTDCFDLYQLHAITDTAQDVEAAFAPDGVMSFIEEAKKDGRIRHVGFSAHSVQAAEMALGLYPFDSILFPVNFATWHKGNFGPQVVTLAQSRGVAILALKALALQKWREGHPERSQWSKCWYEPIHERHLASLALRFTLGQPVTAAIPPGDGRLFDLAMELALQATPLAAGEQAELAAMADALDPVFRFA
jgi:aryl-alcohol dehydrogenase-like predicted oxidoreductase